MPPDGAPSAPMDYAMPKRPLIATRGIPLAAMTTLDRTNGLLGPTNSRKYPREALA
jgi:hypothetical protein